MAKSNPASQASKGTSAKVPTAKGRAGKSRVTRAKGGWDLKDPVSAKVGKGKIPAKVGRVATPAKSRHRHVAPASGNTAFSTALKNVLATVPASARSGFVDVVAGSAEGDLDEALWGPRSTTAERNEAALVNLQRQFEARRQVEDRSLTRAQAAHLLGISEQAVRDRLDAGDLVGIKKGREWRLPAWQFNPDAERGFVPGLPQLLKAFPGGVVTLTAWVTSPNVDLDGATPADELAAGHIDDVVDVARAGTSAAW